MRPAIKLNGAADPVARPAGHPRTGTTLMELLVVMFLISVLLGIGVGVFGKFSLVNSVQNSGAGVRSMIRVIRNYARNHGTVGTIVLKMNRKNKVLDEDGNLLDDKVLGLMVRVVGQWHFENEDQGTSGAFGHDPTLSGGAELVPDGCIGGAVRLDGKAGCEADLGDSSTFGSDWGVSLTADLFLEAEGGGTVVSKGEAYGIRVENDGGLAGWVGVSDGTPGQRPSVVDVHASDDRVPVGRWVKVGLFYDRVQVRLFLDHRQVADTQEQRPLAVDRQHALSVGGSTSSVKGRVDSVRLGVLGPGEGGDLPAEVSLKEGTRVIRFNPDGCLDPRYHDQPARIVLKGSDGTEKILTIGLMGNVSMK